ncbi:hypothetical protein [Antarcticimicrobium sp.]|uniref:hypothetical protein n=1 Tax=Antarcticimicrobium sp. TaxID=2824147 RepID=UPI00261A86C8|nr:hypothetical protein [Antarcticimicrobium sp.]
MAFLAAHHGLMSVWTLTIHVVNGLVLAALAIALGAVLHAGAPVLAPLVRGFGQLWATLVVAGGLRAVLVAGAARVSGLLPGPLPWFGGLVGVSGLLTLLPALSDGAGVVLGFGYIVWFFWLMAALSRAPAEGR